MVNLFHNQELLLLVIRSFRDIIRRNYIQVTPRGRRVKKATLLILRLKR